MMRNDLADAIHAELVKKIRAHDNGELLPAVYGKVGEILYNYLCFNMHEQKLAETLYEEDLLDGAGLALHYLLAEFGPEEGESHHRAYRSERKLEEVVKELCP